MTVSRVIGRSVAAVIEQLELDGDLLVTSDRLAAVLRSAGLPDEDTAVRRMAYELQRGGWLGQLRTRHVWEFLPGARGGAFGSGDRCIEFRAQRAVNPGWSGLLAMESAASVLGLAQRIPEREVVALPPGRAMPKALSRQWRLVGLAMPEPGTTQVDDLPTWNLEGLIIGIAARPSSYQDMAGLAQWSPEAAGRVDIDRLLDLLTALRPAARQRAAYLLGAAGHTAARSAVMSRYPATSVAWFGPRVGGNGVFDPETQVNDTLLHTYVSVGTGS